MGEGRWVGRGGEEGKEGCCCRVQRRGWISRGWERERQRGSD